MRLLFEIDAKDYNANGVAFVRHSARCIAIKNGKVALVHSGKLNYYKFPGGGVEVDETPAQACIREAREEAGLVVVHDTMQEYGYVHRIQASDHADADYFLQDNFYYLCDVLDDVVAQSLDDYESDEKFTLQWVTPQQAIATNMAFLGNVFDNVMRYREATVFQMLIDEGYFD